MAEDDPTLSAQVVLKPRDGRDLTGPITAATLAGYQPDPQAVAALAEHFRAAGFAVGPAAGISFDITAARSRFEQVFGTRLTLDRDPGGQVRQVTSAGGGLELPLGRLPAPLGRLVHAVTFTPPPDFGPGGYA